MPMNDSTSSLPPSAGASEVDSKAPASKTPGTLVSVVIPTYCESQNLRELVASIHEVMHASGLQEEIVVVDDDSPDDTKAVCRELSARYPIKLLVRTGPRGLSGAVIHGIEQSVGNTIVVMDADHSHPPEAIPRLVDALESGDAEFVFGSRYVAGGGTDDDWGILRRINSSVATLLARPLTSAKDPMAGFFAIRRDTFRRAEELSPIGYKIGLELVVKCRCRQVKEVPIQFHNRMHGESKLTIREQLNYLRHLKRLYEFKLGRAARPVQFALIGASGACVDLLCFHGLLRKLPFALARAVAIAIAMSWNFWLNRRLTFSYARSRAVFPQYLKFCVSCSLGAAANWAFSTAVWIFASDIVHSPIVAAVIGILAGTGFNYALSERFVFKR
jgi:dolichol-phosphate mannosyltransferase